MRDGKICFGLFLNAFNYVKDKNKTGTKTIKKKKKD